MAFAWAFDIYRNERVLLQPLINENTLSKTLSEKITQANALNSLSSYTYANDEFGKFLNQIKDSPLKDTTIIAATGDHRARDLSIDERAEKAFAYSVPLYIFVPQSLRKNLHYDSKAIGSHKDIFPTLYALSLSKIP